MRTRRTRASAASDAPRPSRGRSSLIAVAVLVGPLVAACSPDESDGSDESTAPVVTCEPGAPIDGDIAIATTVSPITNIVSVVAAGSGHDVVGLVPEGTNSHTYEPTPSVAAELERTDVLFLNGLDLEVPTRRLADANLGSDSVVCELGDAVLPEDEYIFDFSFPESAGSPNPHLWTNPPMALEYAEVVTEALSAVDPANAELYEANTAAFGERVDEFDVAVREAGDTIPPDERLLLTYHDAYAYFADEYGWTVVGAVQPSSFSEPTPREVAALIDQVRSSGVSAIFGSEVFPSPVLRQIADETGVTYVDDLRDDDLPGEPGDPEHSWLGLMRLNLVTIVEALGGDATAIRELDVAPAAPDEATYAP